MSGSPVFKLPPPHSLSPNGVDDSLRYYYHPLVGFLYRARTRNSLSLLNGTYPSVLEIGYGSGVLMPALAQIAQRLYGCDLESEPVSTEKNLKKLGVNAELTRADVHRLPYANASFDLVVAVSMMQYFAKPEEVFKEVARVLKPGGFFLVGVPRVDRLMETLLHAIGFHRTGVLHHSGYPELLKSSVGHFQCVKLRPLPRFLPAGAALYVSMLLRKLD